MAIKGIKELKEIIRSIVLEVFPELQGYHYPIRAKVVKVHEKGGKVDEFNNLYSCDVQPLKKDGSIDEESPVIPDVEIPVLWAGNQRGIFCLPKVGTFVRVAFYYNDPAQPYLDAVLPRGYEIPEHAIDSIIIQHSEGVKIEINPAGEILIQSEEQIKVVVPNVEIEANQSGQLLITAKESILQADSILLGSDGASEPVVLGNQLKSFLLGQYKHVGNLGIPTTPMNTLTPTQLSKKIKGE